MLKSNIPELPEEFPERIEKLEQIPEGPLKQDKALEVVLRNYLKYHELEVKYLGLRKWIEELRK